MPQDDICPTCKQPRQAPGGNSGSLTDWISKCRCGLLAEEEEHFLSLRFCQNCQKRVSDSRHGSLTQWIFRADLCSCEKPLPVKYSPGDDSTTEQSTFETVELEELEDIDVDFPVEHFKPVEEIGRGGSGVVFRSQDRRLQNIVAIKILQNFDPEQVVSFQTEAKITALLKHENIIQIRDIGLVNETTPYMVLEYVAGLNLTDYILQSGPLDWLSTVELAKQIASAIQYAHDQDIYHRDITPRNILLTKDSDGEILAKVIDFGVASYQQRMEDRVEYQGLTLAGTPGYLCPDQAAGLKYDASCDIYSIGCVIYEALTGSPLYEGESAMELLGNQLSMDIESELDSLDVPEQLQAILKRCLAKERDQRYKTASELLEDLELCLEGAEEEEEEAPGVETHSSFTKILAISLLALALAGAVLFCWLIFSEYLPSSTTKLSEAKEPLSGFVSGEQLGKIEELEPGVFEALNLTDDDTLKFFQNRKNVKVLVLADTVVTGKGFKYLVHLPIRELSLENTLITDDTVSTLSKIKSLKSVSFSDTSLTGVNLDKFENLVHIDMRKSKLNDSGAESISRIKRLHHLRISGEHLSRAGMESLAKTRRLKQLEVEGNFLSSSDLEPIKDMPYLENLTFRDRTLSKEDILLAQSKNIENFNCWNTKLKSIDLFRYFGQLENLKTLELGMPDISANEFQAIKASLSDCVVTNNSTYVQHNDDVTRADKLERKSIVIDVMKPETK